MSELELKNEDDVLAKVDAFAELPDAPPKRKLKLSWVGKLASLVVIFWLVIIAVGPSIAPHHEMDMRLSKSETIVGAGSVRRRCRA